MRCWTQRSKLSGNGLWWFAKRGRPSSYLREFIADPYLDYFGASIFCDLQAIQWLQVHTKAAHQCLSVSWTHMFYILFFIFVASLLFMFEFWSANAQEQKALGSVQPRSPRLRSSCTMKHAELTRGLRCTQEQRGLRRSQQQRHNAMFFLTPSKNGYF